MTWVANGVPDIEVEFRELREQVDRLRKQLEAIEARGFARGVEAAAKLADESARYISGVDDRATLASRFGILATKIRVLTPT